jgi:hypothetical protein
MDRRLLLTSMSRQGGCDLVPGPSSRGHQEAVLGDNHVRLVRFLVADSSSERSKQPIQLTTWRLMARGRAKRCPVRSQTPIQGRTGRPQGSRLRLSRPRDTADRERGSPVAAGGPISTGATEGFMRARVGASAVLDAAQAVIDEHITSADCFGRCAKCGDAWPCAERSRAHSTFYAAPRLPRRSPAAPAGSTGVAWSPVDWFKSGRISVVGRGEPVSGGLRLRPVRA